MLLDYTTISRMCCSRHVFLSCSSSPKYPRSSFINLSVGHLSARDWGGHDGERVVCNDIPCIKSLDFLCVSFCGASTGNHLHQPPAHPSSFDVHEWSHCQCRNIMMASRKNCPRESMLDKQRIKIDNQNGGKLVKVLEGNNVHWSSVVWTLESILMKEVRFLSRKTIH